MKLNHMKKFKMVMSVVLSIVIVIGGLWSAGLISTTAAPGITYLVEDNFNADSPGTVPAGWSDAGTTGGTAHVVEEPSARNHSVKLNDTSTDYPVFLTKAFAASAGMLTVEYDIMPGQTGTYLAAGYIMDSAGKRAIRAYFNHTSNEMKAYNGSSTEVILNYSADTWYHMKYVLDVSSAKFDVYINGELIKAGMAFHEALTDVSQIQYFVGATTAGTMNVDNVYIYEGGELAGISEVYDNQVTASFPADWSLDDGAGGTAEIVEDPSAADKSVKLNSTIDTGPIIISRSFAPVKDRLTIEFDAKAGQTGAYLAAGFIEDNSGNRAVSTFFNHTTNEIKAHNANLSEVVQTYEANIWYHIKYVLDVPSAKYDIYIDGALLKQGMAFKNPIAEVTKIIFFVGHTSIGTMNFDNLKIHKGGTMAGPIVDDNFNSVAPQTTPTGWILDTTSIGTATAEPEPSPIDQSLLLDNQTDTAPVIVTRDFTATSGTVSVEFDMRPGQTGAYLAAGDVQDVNGNRSAYAYFSHSENNILAYNGSKTEVVQAYSANTWYHFKYVLDTYTSKYDIYIDGILKKRGLQFREAASSVSKLEFFVGSTSIGTTNVDNVKVHQRDGLAPMIINDTFDQYATGTIPTVGGSALIQYSPGSSTDKVVELYSNSTHTNAVADREFTKISGVVTYEFQFMVPSRISAGIGYAVNGVGRRAVQLNLTSAGDIVANSSTNPVVVFSNYSANTWYNVSYVLDTGTDTFDVTINTVTTSNLPFNSKVSDVNFVRFAVPNSTVGKLYYDAVKVIQGTTSYVYDIFNSEVIKAKPSGWSLYDKGWTLDVAGGGVTIEEEPNATNKSLWLNDSSTDSGAAAVNSFGPLSGNVTVEFNIKPSQTNAYIGAGYLYNTEGTRVVRVIFDDSTTNTGNIVAYNGSAAEIIGTYTANTWYTLKYVLDTTTSTYDVYIDGQPVALGLTFFSLKSEVSSIKFFTSAATTGNVYVNNVRVYSDEVPNSGFFGASVNPTGNPIGGGAGYSDIITASQAHFPVVTTLQGLKDALGSATEGQIIYIDDAAQIDLTPQGVTPLYIPGGVTLASGRGNNGSQGALLYTDLFCEKEYNSDGTISKDCNMNDYTISGLFTTSGADARITGIRLRGPDGEERKYLNAAPYKGTYDASLSVGILSEYPVRIDNNEIYNWANAGIKTGDAHIHHNYIHHTQRTGLGYGVTSDFMAGKGYLVEANIFDIFRHAIAANGAPEESYEARYNLVKKGTFHAFDMHMWRESNGQSNKPEVAGGWIKIHHNTFEQVHTNGGADRMGLYVRSIPLSGAYVNNNWFYINNTDIAVKQSNAFGNMFVGSNAYGLNKEIITGKFYGDTSQY